MKRPHTDLYHCLRCGTVVCRDHGASGPHCCGEPMVRAVANAEVDIDRGRLWADERETDGDSGDDERG